MKITRFKRNPIITPEIDPRIGNNINGPSLIKTPDWLENPLGRYYLYFAHHNGKFIRLAYTDKLEGPWKIYGPGTLKLEESFCHLHIASPDVHVDHEKREILMYYHGPISYDPKNQKTRVAISEDGISFNCLKEILGNSYFRVFKWKDSFYALGMPGIFYRSVSGLTGFEKGPTLFTKDMRHSAVKLDSDVLSVFYSNVGDCPEHILLSTIKLTPNWMKWKESEPITVLEPETIYEGVELPLEPSERGWAPEPVRQLRDPAIFREGERVFLLYSVAGEQGIAISEIKM